MFDKTPLFAPFRKRKFLFQYDTSGRGGSKSLEKFDLCPVVKYFCQLRFAPKYDALVLHLHCFFSLQETKWVVRYSLPYVSEDQTIFTLSLTGINYSKSLPLF